MQFAAHCANYPGTCCLRIQFNALRAYNTDMSNGTRSPSTNPTHTRCHFLLILARIPWLPCSTPQNGAILDWNVECVKPSLAAK